MEEHKAVSPEERLDARIELLVKEKELTRLRDAVSAQRRALPWVTIEKGYVFDAPEGRVTLSDLFDFCRTWPDQTEVTIPACTSSKKTPANRLAKPSPPGSTPSPKH
jgi:Bacterial protein of unknown function (DUF899)